MPARIIHFNNDDWRRLHRRLLEAYHDRGITSAEFAEVERRLQTAVQAGRADQPGD